MHLVLPRVRRVVLLPTGCTRFPTAHPQLSIIPRLEAAIVQWREAQRILKEMQRLSRRVLFETIPNPPRRKKLGKKVLGLM